MMYHSDKDDRKEGIWLGEWFPKKIPENNPKKKLNDDTMTRYDE